MSKSSLSYYRALRAKNKAAGICIACRQQPARPNQTKCNQCAIRAVALIVKRTKECKAKRLCYTCRKPLMEMWTQARCPPCQQESTERINLGGKLRNE